MRAIDLMIKDLRELMRDWRAASFLVAMPLVFTLILGLAFGGFGGPTDPRLPVGFLDRDGSSLLSRSLLEMLRASEVVRPVVLQEGDDLDGQVHDGELAAAIVVPAGYNEQMLAAPFPTTTSISVAGGVAAPAADKLEVVANPGASASSTVQAEVQRMAFRLASAVEAARISVGLYAAVASYSGPAVRQAFFQQSLDRALQAWADPPLTVAESASGAIEVKKGEITNGFSHASPSMMLQFAMAGMMASGQILVLERRTRALQRLLTTAISRAEIILGHFLTMFVMIFVQFVLLMSFGQLVLRVGYFREPLAVLLLTLTTALWVASLGLLIGALAKTEDQVTFFSIIPMFILSGLGGAWIPLEYTGAAFQTVGHLTPVAWAIDGFKNIVIRGLGLSSVLLPAGLLLAYTAVFFGLAVWRFRFE